MHWCLFSQNISNTGHDLGAVEPDFQEMSADICSRSREGQGSRRIFKSLPGGASNAPTQPEYLERDESKKNSDNCEAHVSHLIKVHYLLCLHVSHSAGALLAPEPPSPETGAR